MEAGSLKFGTHELMYIPLRDFVVILVPVPVRSVHCQAI